MKNKDPKKSTQVQTPEYFTVRGQITKEGELFAGAIVRAYDKDLRREQWLGESITDKAGNYEIRYDLKHYTDAEQGNADLFIRVFGADDQLIGTSDVVFNASYVQEINYEIGADKKSEWEQLNEVLLPLLKEQKLSDYKPAVLYENLPPAELLPADIQFLARDSGLAEEIIQKWSQAYATAIEQNDIPSEVFYAWFSSGLPDRLSDLWMFSVEQLMGALKLAIENGIVPASLEASLEKLQAKIQHVNDVAAQAPLMEKIQMLSAGFNGDKKLINKFTQIYLEHKGDWAVIKSLLITNKSFPEKILNNIFFAHELMIWSGGNTVLIDMFQQDTTTSSLRDIAINYNKQTLSDRIPDAAIPSSETKESFGRQLYNDLYAQESTAVVINMINDPKVPLWNDGVGKVVSAILLKVPDFNIKTTSIYRVINDRKLLEQVAKKNIDSAISSLKTLQRITLMSPVPEAVPALINNNYLSVYAVTALPPAQFIGSMQGSQLPYETLTHIYEAAEKKKAFYEQVLITVKETGERTGIAMIDGGKTISTVNARLIDPEVEAILTKNNLSWDLLFGDADFCECGECTSVYSAASYYVDLLQYLRNNNLDTDHVEMDANSIANTPLAALFARRPDLGHLELTCKNTNTILPYVDLVNEVMEQYIAFKAANFANYKGFNVANETSGELLAAPQHTEQHEAYQALSSSVFPFTLPYHQPTDATRIFLNQLGTSRYEVINTFRSNNTDINFDIAADAEFLGLTEEEYVIITKEFFNGAANNHTTDGYYGLKDITNWLEKLSGVKDELLPRTGIQYTELVELLKTKYINPNLAEPEYMAMFNSLSQPFSEALDFYNDDMGGDNSGVFFYNPNLKTLLASYDEATRSQKLSDFFNSDLFMTVVNCILLSNPDNSCSIDDVKLLHYDKTYLNDTDYDRMHRFIRLWRKLGFSIDETDQVIMVLGGGDITYELIHQLVALKKIMSHTGIELTKLLCFWGNIGTTGENALYKRLFLSYNLTAMDNVFERDLTGNEQLSDHLPVVMAALNLSADDILSIEIYKSLPEPLTLSLEHLTLLYRYRLLAKNLELRIPALIKLLEVVGNVFEDPNTTLRFLQNIPKIEKAGFTIDQLCYIINGVDNNSNSFFPSKKDVIVVAKKIYDTQIAIEMEHADLVADVTATTEAEKLESIKNKATSGLVRSKAALLYEADRVEQIISIVEGTTIFSTSAPVFPNDPDIPVSLKSKVKYIKVTNATSASLQVVGALIADELTQLKGAVPNSSLIWNKVVDEIEKLQNELFNDVLSGIFTPNLAEETILKSENNAASASAKRIAFLKVFLPYLREKLIQSHIINTLSEHTDLDKATVQSLVVNILKIDGVSLYSQLTSSTALPVPNTSEASWYGKLIPISEDDFTFVVRAAANATFSISLDSHIVLSHTGISTTGTVELRSTELKLASGKVYQLSLEGVQLESLYWKTKTSPVEPLPAKVLLPDFKKKATRATLEKLNKLAILVNVLSLSADELSYLHAKRSDFSDIDLNDLSFYHLLRLINYCSLRDSLPKTGINVLQFWEHLNDTEIELSVQIAHLTKWKKDSIDKFISASHFNLTKGDFKNEKNLLRLQYAFTVASKIGMDIDKLFEWAIPTSDFDACKTISVDIQKSVRAQYNQTDWEQVVKPLNDQLRNNQKNALIAYLLQQPELKAAGVAAADGLFEYFLIDVQMDTCMETSRIKQAISSVQLFIQRCFLGLEEAHYGIRPGVLDRGRWEWMQRYRVWEANRKVFLYPENWIESNLRDDKSPFFKELESELLQKDINKQNVTDALKNYLYKVDEIANMEVVGLYTEGEKDKANKWNKGSKLHVFSRTRNAPYFFYYRYLALDEMNWHPWEKVQVDIPSYDVEDTNGQITGNGCYLVPLVWNGRLLIFFPQIVKKTKPNSDSTGKISALANSAQSNLKPIEYFEVKMTWSEYRNGKWTQKQMSKDAIATKVKYFPFNIKLFKFSPFIYSDKVLIGFDEGYSGKVNIFRFDGGRIDIDAQIQRRSGRFPYFFHKNSETDLAHVPYFNLGSYQYNNDSAVLQNVFYFRESNPNSVTFVNNYQLGGFYKFYHPDLKYLAGKLNTGQLASFFNYNLTIGSIPQIDLSLIDDAFGKSMFSSTSKFFHELKRPYSLYNWELFFHTPIMIADALSRAQQFEEAMKWFHYVFNPIADGVDDKRFWGFAPFKETDSKKVLEQIFAGLSANESDDAINEWRNNPFKPHVVARSRPVAYMKWVVMKYIDNILDWGDYLFRQDTIESINQATQLYVLAGHILGRKPMMIPKRGEVKVQTYRSLMDKWDAFSNAISELEVSAVYSVQPAEYTDMNVGDTISTDIFGSANALYFCIPNNPKLMSYWDTLDDRLFKIRHCQNIEGVFRKLPLFEPPIDPALLVKAAAQGLSISSVINDLNTPMPNYRFYYLQQKALELCNELKSLGGAMLAAIEKKDNETIALIRARHEGTMNNLMMEIKKLQLEEAQKSLESLEQNRKGPEARMAYYLKLIGEEESRVPVVGAEFQELANGIETPVDESGLKLSKYEKEDMDKASEAQVWQIAIGGVETLASIFHALPTMGVDTKPFGIGAGAFWGFPNLANATTAVGRGLKIHADQLSYESSNAAKKGSFQRAMQDRIFQANAAGYELKQIDKQITAQQIRIDIANQEIHNQQKQIDNALEVEDFLKSKYTNEELYVWMRGSMKTLYRQVYNLAYDIAKKAEKTYCFEMGIGQVNFIQSGYFDAGREGLLAGEQLYVGLKQLEAAYQEKRGYDYEITKHISIRQLDPLALLQLKRTGTCEFNIPEVLFDMDYPGHFKRRIKSVSVSIPCIAGPYTGVNATLRLINNQFRISSVANNYPAKMDEQDDRFTAYNIPIAAIAASSAQNDAGVFELNFKDERYLPFEGAGVISKWGVELPAVKQFDYNTISDVILHLKYTASEGGQSLKTSAAQCVISQLNQISQQLSETGMHIPFSLEHDMPGEWHQLKTRGSVSVVIDKLRLPYMVQLVNSTIKEVMLIARIKGNPETFPIKVGSSAVIIKLNTEIGLLIGKSTAIQLETPFVLSIEDGARDLIKELVLMVKYEV